MATMKSITLKTDEVKRVLEGGRVKVCRVIKPQPIFYDKEVELKNTMHFKYQWMDTARWYCPYKVGEKLWVKETFYTDHYHGFTLYKADYPQVIDDDGDIITVTQKSAAKWSSSVHMMKEDSRLTIETIEIEVKKDENGVWVWVMTVQQIQQEG